MRSKGQDKAERFLVLLFNECLRQFDIKSVSQVEEGLVRSFENISPADRRLAISVLRRVCASLKTGIRVATIRDVQRVILSASYWSYLVRAFAMEMSFDEDAKTRRWTEVESLAQASKDDVFRISDYFERFLPNEF